MKPIPLNAETEQIARSLIWFESPEEALADPVRFMAYAMARATHEQMRTILRYVTDAEFRQALDNAPPGLSTLAPGPTGTRSPAAIPRRHCPRAGLGDRRRRLQDEKAFRPFRRRLNTLREGPVWQGRFIERVRAMG
jgi:hypothetical protein